MQSSVYSQRSVTPPNYKDNSAEVVLSAGSNAIQISGDDISPPYHRVHARNDFPSTRCSRQAEHRLCVRSPVRVVNRSPFCYLYSLRRLSPHYKLSWFPILSSCLDSMIFITSTESLLMAPRCLGSDDRVHPSINHLPLKISLLTQFLMAIRTKQLHTWFSCYPLLLCLGYQLRYITLTTLFMVASYPKSGIFSLCRSFSTTRSKSGEIKEQEFPLTLLSDKRFR